MCVLHYYNNICVFVLLALHNTQQNRFIGHNCKKAIERVGPEHVIAVVFDGGGDWQATIEMIQSFYPWISGIHCVSHSVSLIIKDCFKEAGGIAELVEMDTWMTNCQHWFSTHACTSFLKDQARPDEKRSFLWPAATRYCGVLLKWKRFLDMKAVLRRVVGSGVYEEKNFADDEYAEKIAGAEVWENINRVITMMGPLLLLARLADGQKPVISKLHGTQLYVRKFMTDRASTTAEGSIERQILDVFLRRWPNMQSEIVSAAYMLDPLFVSQSSQSADCTNKLWSVARRVLRPKDDAEWTRLKGTLVEQLAQFQSKGEDLEHMSSPAAWEKLSSKCALKWWLQWGVETPELQALAKKIVPLIVGSGSAERTWKDVGNVLTKNRNKLDSATFIDLVFVRTWLRRELHVMSDEGAECFQEWEEKLLKEAGQYLGDGDGDGAAATAAANPDVRIFEDRFEEWEQDAIDGTGSDPRIRLGVVKKDKTGKFRLQEKYQNLFFVDKDVDGDNDYYFPGGGDGPLPPDMWEHRKIMGLAWENNRGRRVETKLCGDMAGASTNYVINEVLIRMIKDSTRNTDIKFRSEM